MGIASGGPHPAMAEELPDHGEALPESERPRRERVPEVVDADVVEPRPRPEDLPGVLEVPEWLAHLAARDHPRVAGDPRQVRDDLRAGRREGHQPRPRLAVGKPQLARLEVDVLPAEAENLAPPAAGEDEEPDRGDGGRRGPTPAPRRRLQDPTEAPQLLLGEEALVRTLPELLDGPAGVPGASWTKPLVLGHVEDPGEKVNGPVRGVGRLAKRVVQGGDLLAADGGNRGIADGRHDVLSDRGPIEDLRPRLAADRDVLLEIARGELRHRDPGTGRGRGIVPGLDAGDDAGRPLPRLAGRDRSVAPDGEAPGAALSPALHHEGLGARGIDPHPEAGEVPVPEDHVPLRDGEPSHGPRGEPQAPG